MNRWVRLSAAVVAMMMIANLQYSWTLFVHPLMAATRSKLSDVQLAFTLFIALETWSMALSGWLIDRLGPRFFLSFAGVLCGFGWAAMGHAHTALYPVLAGRLRRRDGLLRLDLRRPEVVSRPPWSCGRHHRGGLWLRG